MSAGELVGPLSEKAAKELGLPAGIAIGSGVIDAYAGWVGTVGAKVEVTAGHLDDSAASNDVSQAFTRLASVAGTSTCHLAMSKEPVFVPGVWGPYRDVLMPDFWMAEGGQSATGELLKHMLETHPAYQETLKEAQAADKNIYDFLNEYLRVLAKGNKSPSVAYLARHFFFYGDLWGNRSPIADPSMKGALIGMGSDKSKDGMALLYYVTMEFIALQTRQIVETMNKSGHSILSIFMSGSQCQNDILMDLISTACDMPVLIPRYVHAAVVHGAAMLGLPRVVPFGRSVLIGQRRQLFFIQLRPRHRLRGSSESRGEQRDEIRRQPLVVQGRSRRGPPEGTLDEESVLVSFLRGAGDFRARSLVHHVEKFGPLETHPAGTCFLGHGGFGDSGNPLFSEGGREAVVNLAITLRRAQILERVTAGNHQRISPIVSMIHDSAASRPPAEIEGFARRQRGAYKGDFLTVTKRERCRAPVIVTKSRRIRFRVSLQQQKIDRHVFRRASDARGQDVQIHFPQHARKSAADQPVLTR